MTTDPIPAVPRRTRPENLRPNTADAWAAAWLAIGEAGEIDRRDVIVAMRRTSPISWRTAKDVLIQAVADGLLEVVSKDRYGRPTLKRKS